MAFYTTYLVPFFATVGFALSVWKFIADWRRDRPRIRLRVNGSNFYITNHSTSDVYLDHVGYIDRDSKAKVGNFEMRAPRDDSTGKIARGATLMVSITLGTTLNAAFNAAHGGTPLPAIAWWAQIQTGQRATTLRWWRLDQRLRFWLVNR